MCRSRSGVAQKLFPRARGRLLAAASDGIAHRRICLHILHAVVIHDAQIALAKRFGHRFGHFRFGLHELRPVFLDLGDVLLHLRGGGTIQRALQLCQAGCQLQTGRPQRARVWCLDGGRIPTTLTATEDAALAASVVTRTGAQQEMLLPAWYGRAALVIWTW